MLFECFYNVLSNYLLTFYANVVYVGSRCWFYTIKWGKKFPSTSQCAIWKWGDSMSRCWWRLVRGRKAEQPALIVWGVVNLYHRKMVFCIAKKLASFCIFYWWWVVYILVIETSGCNPLILWLQSLLVWCFKVNFNLL